MEVYLKASNYEISAQSGEGEWRVAREGIDFVWRRHQGKAEAAALYQSKLLIARHQLAEFVTEHPMLKLPVTFDNWYTKPTFCRYVERELQLPYVGTLAKGDQVNLKSGPETLETFANRLKEEHLAAGKVGGKSVFHKITIPYKGEQET